MLSYYLQLYLMGSPFPPCFATKAVYENAISSMRVTYLVNSMLLDSMAYHPFNKLFSRLYIVQTHFHSKQIVG
jgi:hypothetical protein